MTSETIAAAAEPPTEPTANKRSMVPMTREQYEAKQKEVREVYDPESGRTRLVRGTGEIIERLVSRNEHTMINQLATRGDGTSFAKQIHDAANYLKKK